MTRFLAVALGLVSVTATGRAEPVIAVAVGPTISAPFPAADAELRVGYRVAPRWWWFAGGSYGPAMT